MKLRYYLRGLGIGMLVAALVLILSGNTGGRMSDEAVKQRAAQLGMVEKDKSVLGEIQSGEDVLDGSGTDEEKPGNSDLESDAFSEDAEAEKTEDPASIQEEENAAVSDEEGGNDADAQEAAEVQAQDEEQALAEEIEQRAEDVAVRAEEVAENAVQGEIVTFIVERGDTSVSVARRAQGMGLVKSAADFDVFLCQNGYDKRISIGSYEITVGESEKEIADKITRSR